MIALLIACTDDADTVKVFGEVFDAPPSGAALAPNTTLTTYEEDGVTEVDHVVADDAGVFEVKVPAGRTFVLTATGTDGRTASFASLAPLYDFYAGEGVPWVASQAWLDGVATTWDGCTQADGGLVIGEVRAPVGTIAEAQLWPLVPEAEVEITDADGVVHTPCYLDDEGVVDPTLTSTSTMGAFATFGLATGPALVEVRVYDADAVATSEIYDVWLAENGVVGMYPAIAPSD